MIHSLPTISTVHGVFTVVIEQYASVLVTTPTIQTILSIGKRRSCAFITATDQEIGRLTLKLRDDDAQFWYELLASSTYTEVCYNIQIKITLTEGATERYFFYGFPLRNGIKWTTHYIGTNRIRTCELTIVEASRAIFDGSVETWLEIVQGEAIGTSASVTYEPSKVMSVRGVFAALIYAGGLNAAFDKGDVSFVYGTQDLKFGIADNNVGELYIATELFDVGPTEYFDSSVPATSFYHYYSTIKDLMADLLHNFGLVFQVYYDLANSRYKGKIIQCRRAYTTDLSFSGREKIEDETTASELLISGTRFTQLTDDAKFAWASSVAFDPYVIAVTAPPSNISFDLDYKTIFSQAPIATNPGSTGKELFYSATEIETSDAPPVLVVGTSNYYSYRQEADQSVSSSATTIVERMMSGYYLNQLGIQWKKFSHNYGKITASENGGGETFSVVDMLKRRSINDDADTLNYLANLVEMDSESAEVKIDWIQEEL